MNLYRTARRVVIAAALAAGAVGAAAPVISAAPNPEAGVFIDNDSAAIIAGSVRVRGCLTSGTVNLEWKFNSTNNSAAARWTQGCVSIIRNGATQSRLIAEYQRANGTVLTTRTLLCNKGITVNPVHNCLLAGGGLDIPFTVGLDKVVLKLKTTSPAGPEVTQTVVVGD
jgi:hypothetical protein